MMYEKTQVDQSSFVLLNKGEYYCDGYIKEKCGHTECYFHKGKITIPEGDRYQFYLRINFCSVAGKPVERRPIDFEWEMRKIIEDEDKKGDAKILL